VDGKFSLPSTASEWVALVLGVSLLLVGVVDAWLAIVHGEASTISAVVRDASHRYPVIPLAVGLVVGHLFL
jgi:hypothetical protein